MVRLKAEEFLRKALQRSKTGLQETDAIILDAKATRFQNNARLQITYIDLRKNIVSRKSADASWYEILEKKYRDALGNGKLLLAKISYEFNRIEKIEFKSEAEISKVLEILDAIADADPKYKYVELEGKFIDQDTSCAVVMQSGSVIIPYNLVSIQLLKDSMHGKNISAVIIAHEGLNSNVIDAFIIKSIEEESTTGKGEEGTEDEDTTTEEERVELPSEKQKIVDELLAQLRES